ncbi:ABC transporter substrate-binding protein [Tunicatimonas pelagia]|uniref:ABC transporter substrate-binding protein n=1 Tax=Tunicatimonas pelagia TaxID=931531 RepID=UPI0026658926|nr:ABC transporter substrate-binding protein [Tunicatimonas pelagia]WKN42641.1 ABC transporter substrate-binding protein [Tunicatimonas pelagia]
MIRACSFLPAATQMIYDLELQDQLHGVTFECPEEARKIKPVAVRYLLEGKQYSSAEINRIFSTSKAQGKSLYYVDQEVLQAASPDVIFTQDICEVCQIDASCAAEAAATLATSPALVSITPQSLNDVFDTVITIGQALGAEAVAYRHLPQLRNRLDAIVDQLRAHRAMPRRVMLLEWIDPIYNCGHWIPDQITYAGGTDLLAHPGGDSIVTSWDKIVRYDPEILVIAPCGFTIERSLEEMECLTQQSGWSTMRAVREQKVFIAEYDLFTQSSAANLVDGIELLAALFHPAIFSVPAHLQDKYQPLYQSSFASK